LQKNFSKVKPSFADNAQKQLDFSGMKPYFSRLKKAQIDHPIKANSESENSP